MKNDSEYTEKEIDNFLLFADFQIIEDIHDCQMIPEELNFREFLELYQKRHLQKYGCYLTIKN